jgi:pyruvate-ferredoxin/flavodoxin oxidoreductase
MQICDYMASETRFRITEKQNPEHYKVMVESANEEVRRRFHILKRMAGDVAAE